MQAMANKIDVFLYVLSALFLCSGAVCFVFPYIHAPEHPNRFAVFGGASNDVNERIFQHFVGIVFSMQIGFALLTLYIARLPEKMIAVKKAAALAVGVWVVLMNLHDIRDYMVEREKSDVFAKLSTRPAFPAIEMMQQCFINVYAMLLSVSDLIRCFAIVGTTCFPSVCSASISG